jgi:MFS family permease
MRGRYMAVAGFAWSIPNTIGPAAAGYVLDNLDPRLLWYIGGFVCLASALGYFILHSRLGIQERFAPRSVEKEPTSA